MFSRIKPHIIPVALMLLATIAVYGRTLGHEFLLDWDDDKYVVLNDAIKGFTGEHLKAAFNSYYVGNYAPLHIISYMFDYSLWGMTAAGFIATNILLHSLNGVLFYALLRKITWERWQAFFAGLIFLIHPVQVESVVWISQRKNLLAMLFFLVSWHFYLSYRKVVWANGRIFYSGCLTTFFLSLLTKSVAVILPLVLIVYDLCYAEKRRPKSWVADKIPFLILSAIFSLIALQSQNPEFSGGRTGYHGGSVWATLFTMLPVFVRYMEFIFWPVNLSAVYSPAIKTSIDPSVILAALLLAFNCLGGIYLYRFNKKFFLWWALFFIGLLPTSQIIPLITLMNDRYLYFPMLGGAALIAGGIMTAINAWQRTKRMVVTATVCVLLFTISAISYKRSEVWSDSMTLWLDTVRKAPDSTLAWTALGGVYQRSGNIEEAIGCYRRALALDPLEWISLKSIIIIYLKRWELAEALPHLIQLLTFYPESADSYGMLGNYYMQTGDLKKADIAYRRAFELKGTFYSSRGKSGQWRR